MCECTTGRKGPGQTSNRKIACAINLNQNGIQQTMSTRVSSTNWIELDIAKLQLCYIYMPNCVQHPHRNFFGSCSLPTCCLIMLHAYVQIFLLPGKQQYAFSNFRHIETVSGFCNSLTSLLKSWLLNPIYRISRWHFQRPETVGIAIRTDLSPSCKAFACNPIAQLSGCGQTLRLKLCLNLRCIGFDCVEAAIQHYHQAECPADVAKEARYNRHICDLFHLLGASQHTQG